MEPATDAKGMFRCASRCPSSTSPRSPAVTPRRQQHRGQRRPGPARGGARLPPGLVRRAPQHAEHRLLGHQRADRARRRADDARIRLGAGGVMLPNHSPLVIAEQFGTLEAMYPGRIDLGLGRAPGSDQNTMYALRRDPTSADRFPQDVLELQAYLAGDVPRPRRRRRPRQGLERPALHPRLVAVRRPRWPPRSACPTPSPATSRRRCSRPPWPTYRREFTPSAQLDAPVRHRRRQRHRRRHRGARPQEQLQTIRRLRAAGLFGRGRHATPTRRPTCCWSRAPRSTSTRCSPTPRSARRRRSATPGGFAKHADADELIVAHQSPTTAGRLRSVTLLAEAMTPARS